MSLFKKATAYIESLPPERKVRIGLGMVFISSLFFAWSNLLLKQVVEDLSPFTVAFWRGTVGMLIVLILGRFRMKKLLGVKRGLLLTRGLFGVTALTLFFTSVKSTTLSNAVGLFHTYPLFTTLIGVLFFKERWRNVYMLALFLSLGGVLLIVRPELGSIGIGELISLVCVFFVGWVLNLVRYLRKSESVLSIIFYFTAVTSVVSFFPAGVGEIRYSFSMWGGLFGVGLLTTLAQLLLTAGYTFCTASGGSIISLLGLPVTFILSNSFLDERFNWFLVAGSALIFISGYLIAFARRSLNSVST
jgi:drug/metabolite transporter (DMT)-like permease